MTLEELQKAVRVSSIERFPSESKRRYYCNLCSTRTLYYQGVIAQHLALRHRLAYGEAHLAVQAAVSNYFKNGLAC